MELTVGTEQHQKLLGIQRPFGHEHLVADTPSPKVVESPTELVTPEVGDARERIRRAPGQVEADVTTLLDRVCPVLDPDRITEHRMSRTGYVSSRPDSRYVGAPG